MEDKHTVGVITPWDVVGEVDPQTNVRKVNYEKAMNQFGCQEITKEQVERIGKLTTIPVHRFLRRGLVFAHRDLDVFLDAVESKKPIYIYSGRGPSSSSMHIGHIIPFEFISYLQQAFNCKLVIQLTDDEKFLFKDDLSLEETKQFAIENAKDIISIGLDPEKTFIFRNTDYIKSLYQMSLKISKVINVNQVFSVFGFDPASLLGNVAFPPMQIAPSYPEVFPGFLDSDSYCLIPAAIDQDPYFRLGRDVSAKLKLKKPILIYSKFIPALQGLDGKMSASSEVSSIYLSDSHDLIRSKISKYAYSGGKDSVKEHREKGADISVDICCHYLTYFLEDDSELQRITEEYKSGRMLTSEIKKITSDVLVQFIGRIKTKRDSITDETMNKFFTY